MAFKTTTWELSETVAQDFIPPEEGNRWLYINNATYDDATAIYRIEVKDLTNNAEFTLAYFTKNRSESGLIEDMTPNNKAIGTLNSLGIALAGTNIGIPFPGDIIGGVVMGNVKLSQPNDSGKRYPRVYKFEPVPKEIADCASIEQYSLPEVS